MESQEYKDRLNDFTEPIIYNDNWVNYNSFLYQDLVEKQSKYLTDTLLYNDLDKPSIKFLLDEEIYRYNDILEDMIKKITIEDNTVELCNEVYFTSKIEGANTTIKRTIEIHNGSAIKIKKYKSEQMIKNCFDATKYLNLIHSIDKNKLLKLNEIITYDVCDNNDIVGNIIYPYRSGDVSVGSHYGASYKDIEKLMDMYIEYYNNDILKEYPFVKAALLHYCFETIHPFADGNGRCGRMLMNNFLIKNGYEEIKAISFSHTIDKNRGQYDLAFSEAENNIYNDCTYFLKYMLNIYAKTLDEIIKEQNLNKEDYALSKKR